VLDATQCISYFTIELKGSIPEEFRPGIGRHVFGCDICQDVCPWNRKAPLTQLAEFQPRAVNQGTGQNHNAGDAAVNTSGADLGRSTAFNPPLEWLASLTEDEFRENFRRSPIKRTKHRGMLRNAAVAMGNSGSPKFRPALERLAQHSDPIIQDHAAWGLAKLEEAERRGIPHSSK
jgi:epoxyqueuosine reductase